MIKTDNEISKYSKFSLLWPGIIWTIFILVNLFEGKITSYLKPEDAIPYGILVLLLPVIAGFIGVVFGILALKDIRKSNSILKGKKVAITGIVFWWVLFGFYICFSIISD